MDLIRMALAPDASGYRAWESRAVATQARLQHLGPGPALNPARLDALRTIATRDAALRWDETVKPALPMTCAIAVAVLFAAVFVRDRLVPQIRDTASFG